MEYKFTTTVKTAGKTAAGIVVPPEIVEALGSGRNPKVKVSVNGYTFQGTVQVSNGQFMLSFSSDKREASGVKGGDQVEVTLELDTEPRTVEVPEDLRAALSARAGAMEAFEGLAYSRRKEFVRQVNEAKAQETRARRIAGIVAQVGDAD
jgi:antitoxin component of MazEF toxin-antitoxin module